MKVDFIVKNAKIYTVDKKYPWAEAMAVKDGEIVFVGSNEDAQAYEGEVKDVQGRFIMPGIIDPHTHISMASTFMSEGNPEFIGGTSKEDVKSVLKAYIAAHPEMPEYRFYLGAKDLKGERLTRDELDAICPTKPLKITENEHHSVWVNTLMLRIMGADEYEEDIAPGLSYYERDADGRVNGRIVEFCALPGKQLDVPPQQIETDIRKLVDYWKTCGVIAAFDAGAVGSTETLNCFFSTLNRFDKDGELPMRIECCEYIYDPKQLEKAIDRLKALNETHSKGNVKVRTMKIMMDGTFNARTAAMFEDYEDCSSNGGTIIDSDKLFVFLTELNEAGFDFHVHTVGERAVVTVLEAVDKAKKQLGDKFTIQVTCAHVETLPDKYLGEFARLGVIANFTPHWFGGNTFSGYDNISPIIGKKRAGHMYRANSIWNTGALVVFSSDYIMFDNMKHWNPYQGMEVGITRQDLNIGSRIEDDFSKDPALPGEEEKLSLAQMIQGFTINAAKQMRLDDKIGSLEVGKDASFLVFEKSLFDIDKYRIHQQLPQEVYIRGKLQ